MEQNNLPIIAKKSWKLIRVVYFMLKKGISKGKLLSDLSMLMKRGKLAGKAAIQNLMFHHHPAAGRRSHDHHLFFPTPINEYEFSCSNTPAYPIFKLKKRKHTHAPPPVDSDVMAAALEIFYSAAASPALPGFGQSPMVRQLRICDSPSPFINFEDDQHVDKAAEEFIIKFYNNLKRQNSVGYS